MDERTVRQLREDRIRELDAIDGELRRVLAYTKSRQAAVQRERALQASLLVREDSK